MSDMLVRYGKYGPLYMEAMLAHISTYNRTTPELIKLPDTDSGTLYAAIRNKDESITYKRFDDLSEHLRSIEIPDDRPVIHDRYWNRQFPKNYAKSRKAKARQQRQARKRNR